MNRRERKAEQNRLDEQIAELERHQDGRRERIREIKKVIKDKQLKIDNLRAARNRLDEPSAAPTPTRSGLTALP